MKNKIAFALLLTASLLEASTRVWAPLPEVINVHPDFQYATARVLKSYIDAEGIYEIVSPARPPEGTATALPSTDSIKSQAIANKCSQYMVTSMTRLGDNIIMNVELRNAADNSMIWQDRLKASTPDDIDPIAMRIAKALGTSEKAASKEDIYSVTNYDEKSLKQKQSTNSFGVALGGTALPGSPYNSDPFIGGIGLLWSYDTRSLLVDVEGDVYMANEKSFLNTIGLNVWKPMNDGAISPYVGGGLALGLFGYTPSSSYYGSDESKGGLLVSAGGGLLMNRTSTVTLRLDLRYTVATFKVAGSIPHGAQVRLIAAFGK